MPKVKNISACSPLDIPESVLTSNKPVILTGLVDSWPVVKAAKESSEQASHYLNQYYQGMTVGMGVSAHENNGRLFYNEDFSDFNFTKQAAQFDQVLAQLLASQHLNKSPSIYVGSTHVDKLLPGFRQENDLAAISQFKPLVSLWLGNQSRIAAHHDTPSNIACCVAGKRRFTLFPPEQLCNLYIGPLDHTPAGQAISLVDFHKPDFDKFPKFKDAIEQAVVAELEPGDALFLPSMWWHHVEGLSQFNLLINYWWQTTSPHMGAPIDAMMHALLNIKSLPADQKKAWFEMFKHYVFNDDPKALSYIPEQHLGSLNPLNDKSSRQIRSMLLNKLNR
ncbi:cupin [Colwellia sp. 75C3]|uniref:cupin-like domain-containing protein n=1 Tax=Colwellia sp. 75C3 TaxID=888425 RepID=UPI000C3399DD|nr:cupin-like domain-containing protein [Colwellia sp. 75C3]PKG85893.1 cupin [Colwellia sp. 75C3]